MHFVYVLSSKTANYIYVGITDNVDRRVFQHNSGYEPTTKPYRPYIILLVETFPDRSSARLREKYLKSGVGKKMLREMRDSKK